MYNIEQSQRGGKNGGPIASNIEYYCSQCDLTMKGPVYFKHLKSKRHARITHILNHNRRFMGDNSDK